MKVALLVIVAVAATTTTHAFQVPSPRDASAVRAAIVPHEPSSSSPSSSTSSSTGGIPKNEPKPGKEHRELPIRTVLSRTLDQIEAISLTQHDVVDSKAKDPADLSRETVVVLGSGWGAHALMKTADSSKLRLVVVSPTNHFVYTPMLVSLSHGV